MLKQYKFKKLSSPDLNSGRLLESLKFPQRTLIQDTTYIRNTGVVVELGKISILYFRQLSGAMIRISNCEDRESGSNMDRTITITGNAESVALAQYLINMR